MNHFKVAILCLFLLAVTLQTIAKPNCNRNAQYIPGANRQWHKCPMETVEQESQSKTQSKDIERIIEKTHEYYSEALNQALQVIGLSVVILSIGFTLLIVIFQWIVEWQRRRRFDKLLTDKERQLQGYFESRIEDEILKLKEEAKKQANIAKQVANENFKVLYISLEILFHNIYSKEKDGNYLSVKYFLELCLCLIHIESHHKKMAIDTLSGLKENICEVSEGWCETYQPLIDRLSKAVTYAADEKLKQSFDEFHEAFIGRKCELMKGKKQ